MENVKRVMQLTNLFSFFNAGEKNDFKHDFRL